MSLAWLVFHSTLCPLLPDARTPDIKCLTAKLIINSKGLTLEGWLTSQFKLRGRESHGEHKMCCQSIFSAEVLAYEFAILACHSLLKYICISDVMLDAPAGRTRKTSMSSIS